MRSVFTFDILQIQDGQNSYPTDEAIANIVKI
jgi:hypothetical protein